jgi:hypothetical protein
VIFVKNMNSLVTTEEAPPEGLINLRGLLDRYFDPGSQPSEVKIRWLCRHDGLPHLRVGRMFFFRPTLVEAWLAERTFPIKRTTRLGNTKVPAGKVT